MAQEADFCVNRARRGGAETVAESWSARHVEPQEKECAYVTTPWPVASVDAATAWSRGFWQGEGGARTCGRSLRGAV